MVRETYTWIDPDGGEHVLPVHDPKTGRGMPPVDLTEEHVPARAGARLRAARHGVRVLDLACTFRSGDDNEVRAGLRDWMRRLDPTRGDGTLKVDARDGNTYELTCRYAGGMILEEQGWPDWQPAVITFRAHDPYWRDAADTTFDFIAATTNTFFPFPPLDLASAGVLSTVTATNAGDVEAWPVWTISGPFDDIELINHTSGLSLKIDRVTADSETITVDTRPGRKTVELADGTSLYADLTSGSELWPLVYGDNAIDVVATNYSAGTSAVMEYRQRWLMP